MTNEELRKLKSDLWQSADMLREGAHLSNVDYGEPILGLIFLRYADILYKQNKEEIDKEYNRHKGSRNEKSYKDISIKKIGFYLPECAYYEDICNKPDNAKKAELVKKAMQAIEKENEKMADVLPKDVYSQLVPDEEPELLSNIMKVFLTIPNNINIDLFGEIYEFFLGEFSTGKDGGEYYTPSNVVRYIIEVLQPEPGEKKILDPACGSGGMFVQAAKYMHNHNKENNDIADYRCYGVEKDKKTNKIAKMNLLLNNVRGEITEANSFYSDPYDAVGKFDYVMANPPFNVDEVNYEKVKDDRRFNTYGIPRNKTKNSKKDSGKKETVPNANYLWISYFASALNENGKAGLVMANSASDAGKSELEIRKKIINAGIIKQIVSLPTNMFTSVTLPATLWFFDKKKSRSKTKDEILFIDARNIYEKIDKSHRKFTDEQIKDLGIITRLYEGDLNSYKQLIKEYELLMKDAPDISENNEIRTKKYYKSHIDWLKENFPDGKYRDVIGLCKIAKFDDIKLEDGNVEDGIISQGYSLNPGRYVGYTVEIDGLTNKEFEDVIYDDLENIKNKSNESGDLLKRMYSNLENLLSEQSDD